jgi:hypothetical protein
LNRQQRLVLLIEDAVEIANKLDDSYKYKMSTRNYWSETAAFLSMEDCHCYLLKFPKYKGAVDYLEHITLEKFGAEESLDLMTFKVLMALPDCVLEFILKFESVQQAIKIIKQGH